MFKKQCKFFIILVVLLCTGWYSAKATAETNWYQVAANTALVADWAQTRYITDSDDFYEKNPILGHYPSDNDVNKYFITSLILTNLIGELLPETQSNWFYVTVAVVETAQVTLNYSIGIRMKF